MGQNKLTVKQENFCNKYLECGNASEAYRFAYNCLNMKDETITVKASELLKDGKVTVRVKELQDELKEKSDISKEEAVRLLTNMVRCNVSDILHIKGTRVTAKDINKLPKEFQSVIHSVKKVKGGIEIKLHDKISAIDRLSKMLGWDVPDKQGLLGEINQVTIFKLPDNGRDKDK